MSPPNPAALPLGESSGFLPPLGWVAPFVLMLLSIAVLPLVTPHWWDSNRNRFKVALLFGLPVLALFAWHGDWHRITHTLHEYTSFLLLLTALFVASGGIVLDGDLRATPRVNASFLFVGAVFASFMGTTGAAMLLIRPLLKTNSERQYKVHTVVFFIFLVCNIGGCLTPLGDPPLFLGYLRGVPFTWTFTLVKEWAFANVLLLGLYLLLDGYFYKKEDVYHRLMDKVEIRPLRLVGSMNFLWLGVVVAGVALLTDQNLATWTGQSTEAFLPLFGRDLLLVGVALGAYLTTPEDYRRANHFSWHPIVEVAALFFGIFLSMMAAIALLEHHGPELGLHSPTQFFWATGSLSAFLDNAPTYVVFFETARTLAADGHELVAGVQVHLLAAVSLGAVFMGAMTYIGNAPNFMVKSIAEQSKVRMPSFFGYMGYSVLILLPLFFLVTLVFLRG